MLPFGHIGITLGAAWVARGLARRASPGAKARPSRLPYLALLVGSLLPDIVDKLGYLAFPYLFTASRTIAHTFVFSLVLLLGGWLWHRRGRSWLLFLSLASLGHLALDEMWQMPGTLFWPLLGWRFRHVPTEEWTFNFLNMLGNTKVLIAELAGIVVIIALVVSWLWARRARAGREGT